MIYFVLRRLVDFKLKIFLTLLCAIVTAAADLLKPYLSAKFIDEILSSHEIGSAIDISIQSVLLFMAIFFLWTIGTKWLIIFAAVEQKDFLKNDTASGGERRKLSIATAFEKISDVLIMDEPDNNLDAQAVGELIKKILDGKRRRITIIISHDERLIDIADEILSF